MPIIPHIAELIQRHPGAISLGQGVVHYGPPPSTIDALAEFARDPQRHKYQATRGMPVLLEALQRKLAHDNHIALTDEHVLMVTAGSNMAFAHAIAAIADPGDEVILLTPYYFNHDMALTLANVRPVLVPTDEHYQPQLELIARAITPRTRAVVTISPNNPTGAVYDEATLRAINDLCRDRGVYHIHDEAYEYLVFDGAQHVSPGTFTDSARHTISLFSFSKSYGMASWRVGYLVAPHHLDSALQKTQDTELICAPGPSQFAAARALDAGAAWLRPFLEGYAAVRQRIRTEFAPVADSVAIPPTAGALYFFLRVRTAQDALSLAETLIRTHGVAVIPGHTFGVRDECCLRISYGALEGRTVTEGIQRLVRGLSALI